MLDGAQNNDVYSNAPSPLPNPDALQEFSVQTNNFSAEFGRQSGGVVNAITKAGTNQLHGSAFEFLRNQAFNAANYFSPIVNGAKRQDGLKRNQFGGTLGGPVVIPKVYDGHDKTFFFFSYQSTSSSARPPRCAGRTYGGAEERRFSCPASRKPSADPETGQPFPGNIIPSARINPVSRAVLSSSRARRRATRSLPLRRTTPTMIRCSLAGITRSPKATNYQAVTTGHGQANPPI